jgi:endogenous inhibitor of DNA gyrase (YacG/DUF329 family)
VLLKLWHSPIAKDAENNSQQFNQKRRMKMEKLEYFTTTYVDELGDKYTYILDPERYADLFKFHRTCESDEECSTCGFVVGTYKKAPKNSKHLISVTCPQCKKRIRWVDRDAKEVEIKKRQQLKPFWEVNVVKKQRKIQQPGLFDLETHNFKITSHEAGAEKCRYCGVDWLKPVIKRAPPSSPHFLRVMCTACGKRFRWIDYYEMEKLIEKQPELKYFLEDE